MPPDNSKHREEPQAPKISPDVVAKVGANVSFSCEAYVGLNSSNGDEARVSWLKYSFNNKVEFASRLPNVTIMKKTFGSGG